jgi:hypothetical protein
MTVASTDHDRSLRDKPRFARHFGRVEPVMLAIVATVFVVLMGLSGDPAKGVPNSDDLVRLVEVRDLLDGQDWFDLTQYRLGLEGGTLMHWSRLVDAPIAAIVVAGTWLTGSAAIGEALAKVLWPALTLYLAMTALMAACARTGNRSARLPVAVIGAVAFWTIGVFAPGSLDHHNIQVALSLWLVALLLPGERPVLSHAAAGIVAVLMLAIGMEVMPYVALAGAVVALGFVSGAVSQAEARAFGLAIALATGAIFLATISRANWGADSCDAFSSFHLTAGLAAGLGLAAVSGSERTVFARGSGLVLLALAMIAIVAVYFPHCLGNPLAALDPKLRAFWLEGVVETRSLGDLLVTDPFALFGLYGMALAALFVSLLNIRIPRGRARNRALVFATFLAMGLAVTAWQQRGFTFSTAFAILPLGFWIANLRRGNAGPLRLAAGWLVSINLVWWMAGAQAASLFASAPTVQQQAATVSAQDYCYTKDVYAPLAAEPAGVVLGATDLGAGILFYTPHRAVAGPYHRNTAGNLLLIEAMLAPPEKAREMLIGNGITHVADCLKSADSADFMRAAPDGLQAKLRSGAVPDWLQVVPGAETGPMPVYRVIR